jgi:hypothetical protein
MRVASREDSGERAPPARWRSHFAIANFAAVQQLVLNFE